MIGGTIFGGRKGVSQLFAAAESSVAAMERISQAIMPRCFWRGSTGRAVISETRQVEV